MSKLTDELVRSIRLLRDDVSHGTIDAHNIERFEYFIGEYAENKNQIGPEVEKRVDDLLTTLTQSPIPSGAEKTIHDTIYNTLSKYGHSIKKFEQIGYDIDPLNPDDNVVFLLGAGASYDSGIPLVSGLLEKLVEQARRTQNEEFNRLMQRCQNRDDIGIEDLLTAVYLAEFAVSESSTLSLLQYFLFTGESGLTSADRPDNDDFDTDVDLLGDEQIGTDPTSVNFIQDAIQTLFGSIASEMIPDSSNDTHSAIQHFVKKHDNVSIITTNYDYCMEKELFGEVDVDTTLNNVEATSESDDAVELYKMHGSITWTYCDTCQSVDGVRPEKVEERFEPDNGTLGYPVKGICPVCRGERRPLLVPPTSFKFVQFPPLIDIRAGAKKRLQKADYIIPVGYSFSDEDAYIYKLVWGAMRKNKDAKMLVVDPNARELANELQTRFGVQSSDFDPERVQPIPRNSEDVMSDLVNDLLPNNVLPDPSDSDEESAEPGSSEEETAA